MFQFILFLLADTEISYYGRRRNSYLVSLVPTSNSSQQREMQVGAFVAMFLFPSSIYIHQYITDGREIRKRSEYWVGKFRSPNCEGETDRVRTKVRNDQSSRSEWLGTQITSMSESSFTRRGKHSKATAPTFLDADTPHFIWR